MSLSRRASSRPKPSESNENELRLTSDSIPFPTPRSPLNSIQDPSQLSILCQVDPGFVKGAGSTPKSIQIAAGRSGPRVSGGNGSTRERGCSSRVLKGAQDGKCLDAVEVPCFELNEDPAFWEDHNVQVLIRIRPISSMENASQGYKRCIIQESSQSLTWTGHPETRFTFDHVACETISQERLFRVVGLPMVDNCMSGYNSCMFAYGQTGSGKTYTMMGEIQAIDTTHNDDRGITPRIFEYLFTRIREEEECQSEEKLKYSCKCSFLEIYNEQITDLLEPSSTNLQLREDIKKGVYVENLKEFEVSSVKDVMELLLQGAANRKMAATCMNSESSRSHSVFTCIIESWREKDSMTHLRFGRLNLVDLAGSERQKSSGAEGERLKEAANINRSLSTLGLVIMALVDITNGKNRHVPYRDSRLTFLLQDSLGGNSKTTIIANVSPSVCSASETLSTLKFAQRAKLIQNNAKVNEDASGDVMALQRQIQKLKDQLTILISHQSIPKSQFYTFPSLEQTTHGDPPDDSHSLLGGNPVASSDPCLLNREIKQLEASLVGALRREEVAEAAVKRLEAEITHMSHLVHQREDDAQRARTLLRFREEKLRRLELLADDLVTSDGHLMEENFALSQEIQLLRERINRNPELTQFALENKRLLEQLRMYQNFYQQGERDTLLAEVSYLRNQLLKVLEGKLFLVNRDATQVNGDTMKELDECRKQLDASLENNAKLTGEVNDLRLKLEHYSENGQSTVLVAEPTLQRGSSEDKIASSEHADHMNTCQGGLGDTILLFSEVQKELRDAKRVIEEMESQQAFLVAELEHLRKENNRDLEPSTSVHMETHLTEELQNYDQISKRYKNTTNYLDVEQMTECGDTTHLSLHETLQRILKELEQAKLLNRQLSKDLVTESAYHQEMEHGQEQVEAETAKTILYLQEELDALKREFDSKNASQLSLTEHSMFLRTRNEELNSRLSFLIQENVKLSNFVAMRDAELSALSYEWEKAIIDLTTFLVDGCRSLDDASDYVESVVESFPLKTTCISEHVERAIKVFIEKETLILDLQRGLEDAQEKGLEMKSKLNSLRGATIAIAEVQQLENDENTKELARLRKSLIDKSCIIQELESILKGKEDDVIEAEKLSNSAIEVMKKLDSMLTADSLNVREIKLMIRELVNEKPQVRNVQQTRNFDSAGSKIRNLPMDDLTNDVDTPKMYLSPLVQQDSISIEQGTEEHAYMLEDIKSQTQQLEYSHAVQDVEERTNHANNLLKRFEAVQETMGEAELVLQALTEANEGAKHEKDLWKQVSAGLLTDKIALLEEVQRLQTSSYCKEKQYKNLQVQVQANLTEIFGLISLLGESFQKIQRITQEELNVICSDIFSFRQELIKITENSRLCFEDFMSEVMGKGFELFVLYQCHRGAIFEQIMHLNKHSDSSQYKHENASSLFRSEDIFNENMISDRLKDLQALSSPQTFGFSNLGVERKVLDLLQIAQHPDSILGASIRKHERRELLCDLSCSQEGVLQLERENLDLSHDIELLKVITSELAVCSGNLLEELTSRNSVSVFMGSTSEELLQNGTSSEASLSSSFEELGLPSDASQGNRKDLLDSENGIKVDIDGEVINDIKAILNDIHHLRIQFAQPISSKSSTKDHSQLQLQSNCDILDSNRTPLYVQNRETRMLAYRNAKTDGGNQALQAWDNLMDNLQYFLPLFSPGLHTETEKRLRNSLLEKAWETICNMEVKASKLLEKCSRYGIYQADRESNNQSADRESNNQSLKKELQQKDKLVKGLLFDLRLLQESSSNVKGKKDELEEIVADYNQVLCELEIRTAQINKVLAEKELLETQLAGNEAELFSSKSELEQLEVENSKLKLLLEDAYFKKSQTEELLEEKMKVIEGLQSKILSSNSSFGGHVISSAEEIMNRLRRVSSERDHLQSEIVDLNDRLEMASALADENEAIAIEARQIAEASKVYAKEKEEEVKLLECSVEELEDTINILEKKVHEMKEEVERQQSVRRCLELEVQAPTRRMSTVENAAENLIAEYSTVEGEKRQIPRRLDDRIIELCEARQHIEDLEIEKSCTAEEIKQYREYISELVLHSEAQSSLFQEKFKALEAMVCERKLDLPSSGPPGPIADKIEKTPARARGSGSPFRCISNLVHQMNLEKDQELSEARHRIEELGALAASRQQEVCMLTARLAEAESMTHDVIRDLLGIKLDMTSYANLIDQERVQNLLQKADKQTEETITKEKEILSLKKHIDHLIEERESWIEEINQRKADILSSHVMVERLQQREQLLTAQIEMLKMEKSNFRQKIAEMDKKIKCLIKSQNTSIHAVQQPIRIKQEKEMSSTVRASDEEFSRRLAQSDKLLSQTLTSKKNISS